MASTFRTRLKLLARVVAPILLATALNACSSVPDWVDPTTWIGGDSQAAPTDQTSDSGADQSAPAGSDQSAAADQGTAQSSSGGQTPDIAAIPPKPSPPSTTEEQKQVADSLAADRAQAHYSADALRGGTEAAAPPPPAEAAAPQGAASSEAGSTSASGASSSAPADQTTESPSSAPASASGSGDEQTETSQPPAAEAATQPAASSSRVASADSASTSAPAAAPMAAETGTPPAAAASPDMQASFAPSKAPALDPSVSQFVPQPILSHYWQTAAEAAVPSGSSAATPSRHHRHKKIKTSLRVIRLHYAFKSDAALRPMMQAAYSPRRNDQALRARSFSRLPRLDPALFSPNTKTALAVVDFGRETTVLDDSARNRIQSAASNFVALGGGGFMRVVGHASDRAENLPRAIRLRNNFERSEAQATAVARELIRDGVPPQRVLVEAVGDMPIGSNELGKNGRSAEIFLQS